jgi:hypothetical protein
MIDTATYAHALKRQRIYYGLNQVTCKYQCVLLQSSGTYSFTQLAVKLVISSWHCITALPPADHNGCITVE